MTHDQMVAVMMQLMAAKRAHDVNALLALYSEDCLVEQPSLGVSSRGRAALRPALERFAQVFPDYERSFDGVASDGNQLVSWGTARLTLTGVFNGVKPNGKRASVTAFVLFRFDDSGRISYEGHHWDLASLCRQSSIAVECLLPRESLA